MTPGTIDIIARKRDGHALTAEEIDYVIQGYTIGKIPDYQMAALLMAIYWRNMNTAEIAALTRSMLASGSRLDLHSVEGIKVDKHSTGGVGDKISLILAPLLAAAGLKVPMISGRGLLHSGGTLDKLEAIPGFRIDLNDDQVRSQLSQIGLVMIGQTRAIVPADRKIYALRDATATVASIPLITSSILSKKLAEDIDSLILDVKVGRGAFFTQPEDARALARSLIQTAGAQGLKTRALLTNMNQPLGHAIGNWLETWESIQCLNGQGPADLMELTYALATHLIATVTNKPMSAIRNQLEQLIETGAALEKFIALVKFQGGDISVITQPQQYRPSKYQWTISAREDGFIHTIDALEIGLAVVRLGGGRQVIEDSVDYSAGIWLEHKVGEPVKAGDRLATIYTDRNYVLDSVRNQVEAAIVISPQPPILEPLIWQVVDEQGARDWAPIP